MQIQTQSRRKALILRKLLKAMYKPTSATSQHDVTNHSVYIFKTFRLVKKQFEGLLATTRASLPILMQLDELIASFSVGPDEHVLHCENVHLELKHWRFKKQFYPIFHFIACRYLLQTFHYNVSFVSLSQINNKTSTLFSNKVRKYSSRAFIWVVTPLCFVGQFRI